jgi:hypothetical protein
MFKKRFYLMDAVTDGADGGAGAGGVEAEASILESLGKGGDPAVAAVAPVADEQDPAPLTAEATALKASETDARRPAHVPAKFWDAGKGEINHEAWAKSYTGLEQRMKDTGLPPKDADEYTFQPPEGMEQFALDPDEAAAFRSKAHEMGLTQKQYQTVLSEYVALIPGIAEQAINYGRTQAETALKDYYGTPEKITENVKLAFKAFNAYADESDMAQINRIGNMPAVIKILAKVGREMQEDPGVGGDSVLAAESLDELMAKDSPYWDKKHPKHEQVKAKVAKHFQAQEAAKKRKAA